MVRWLVCSIALGLLIGCTRTIGEDDVFLPWMAEGTQFSVTDDDDAVFVANRARDGLFEEMGLKIEDTSVPTTIGSLAVRHVLSPEEDVPLFVYCGGNSYDIPSHGELVTWKVAQHGDLLLWDYPGYGASQGEARVEDFKLAAKDLAGEIESFRRDTAQPVVFWGHSLGGFVCSELAGTTPGAAAIIYEASAPSSEAAITGAVPWYARPFVRAELDPVLLDFESVNALNGEKLSALVLGARKDRVLPVKLSRRLRDDLEAAGHAVSYHEFRKSNHFNIGFDKQLQTVVGSFVATL
ncbi:MAG: alpha/beta fold hydrolase [Pseudomonadota bacterium]